MLIKLSIEHIENKLAGVKNLQVKKKTSKKAGSRTWALKLDSLYAAKIGLFFFFLLNFFILRSL